jgi:peptide/nickel transport system substrate-binding protein
MRIVIFGLLIVLTTVTAEAKNISQNSQPYGGTLIWGVCHKPTIINPILTSYSISASLMDLIFSHLVRLNSKGEIEPDLAKSWDISSDGLVYTFHLRKGVKFHDGEECTASDVKFTFDKLIEPRTKSPFRESFELVEEFRAIDKWTFQVKLNQPSNTFIYRLTREIAPKHLLEKVDLKNCCFNFHPVGSGPFKFKQWTKDDRIILEYNPDYYEGRPYLDEIIVKTYPSVSDVWIALMRSEIDYAGFIVREDYEIAKDDQTFKTYAFPFDSYYAIFYNPDDPLLADKKIRQAIAYGIDRKGLIKKIAGGYGIECNGPFYPGSIGFNPQVTPFEYNPDKSKELLAQAGWQDNNADGILEKPGEDLELKMLVDARNDIFKRISMFIRQELQEIGIKLRVLLYNDEEELTYEFLEQNKPQAQLKLYLGGADPEGTEYYWSYEKTKKADKLWMYRNEEVAELFALGEITQDKEQLKQIYQKIHQLISADQPACFLYFPFLFFAISSKFENTEAYFSLNMPTYTIKDWFITTKEQRIAKKGGEYGNY